MARTSNPTSMVDSILASWIRQAPGADSLSAKCWKADSRLRRKVARVRIIRALTSK